MHENNNLSQIMYKNNLTYRELGRLSGVSISALNDIANFKKDPRQSTMIAIARALNMEVVDVFNLDWRNDYVKRR